MNRNPQAEQMSSEPMVRTLAAQTEAIWPQERPLLESYSLSASPWILDVGCGTGELERRLFPLHPTAHWFGLDLDGHHLRRGIEALHRAWPESRSLWLQGDAFFLPFPDESFDLVLCRHVLQAVPRPETLLRELSRVLRPGGFLHLLVEDYGMLHFQSESRNCDDFWHQGPLVFSEKVGCDFRIGRHAPSLIKKLGLELLSVDYAVLDPLRVPREVMIRIWEAWRDGYSEVLAEKTAWSLSEVHSFWSEMLRQMGDPDTYWVWQVPLVGAQKPLRALGVDADLQ